MPLSKYTKREAWNKFKYRGGFATAPLPSATRKGVRPQEVDITVVGHHCSIGFDRGIRTYSFHTAEGRDKFIELYRDCGAEACEDPYP